MIVYEFIEHLYGLFTLDILAVREEVMIGLQRLRFVRK